MPKETDTDELLRRAGQADSSAIALLFDRHRSKLRRLVALRIDKRLAARVDPSDVVQEALIEAHRLLPKFLDERPVAFCP